MKKIQPKTIIVMVVLLISLCTLGAYYVLKTPASNPVFETLNLSTLSCDADTDCILFTPDCEDCTFEAVHISQLTELRNQKELFCSKHPPKMMCDIAFAGEVKCIEKKCTVVTR